ncbi:uncharacterized protein LOC144340578 [Macaca mulatta]
MSSHHRVGFCTSTSQSSQKHSFLEGPGHLCKIFLNRDISNHLRPLAGSELTTPQDLRSFSRSKWPSCTHGKSAASTEDLGQQCSEMGFMKASVTHPCPRMFSLRFSRSDVPGQQIQLQNWGLPAWPTQQDPVSTKN